MNIHDLMATDNEEENTINEMINKSEKENIISEIFSVMLTNTTYTTINAFGLGNKVIAVTTDNVSNMNVFGDKLAKCAAHILNLVARDGLNEAGLSVKKKCSILVPETDTSTHWNSTYIMIEKLYKIQEITDILVALIKLLEPIYHATNILSSSSYPTLGDLHMVFPVIINTINEVQNESAILDPNNKLIPFEHENISKVQQIIYETYRTHYITKNKITEELPKSGSLRDYFQHHLKRSYDMFADNNNSLREYLNLPIEEVDILTYWKAKSLNSRWSSLACIARDYLIVQATSVASEQMFSVAKFTISPTRCCLDPEKARAALCLKT
ncbi:1684_t:CDS:2, partial [Cetraspora pellucida]